MNYLTTLLLLYSITCCAQQNDKKGTIKVKNEKIYLLKEVTLKPYFPGGNDSLRKFIYNNHFYIKNNLEQFPNMQTIPYIHVTFVVEKNGTISNLKYDDKRLWNDYNLATKMACEQIPNFIPGEYLGEKVRVQMDYTFEGSKTKLYIYGKGNGSLFKKNQTIHETTHIHFYFIFFYMLFPGK